MVNPLFPCGTYQNPYTERDVYVGWWPNAQYSPYYSLGYYGGGNGRRGKRNAMMQSSPQQQQQQSWGPCDTPIYIYRPQQVIQDFKCLKIKGR